jgi:hypothetical protein
MSRSHIRIKSFISVRMAAEMYKTKGLLQYWEHP